jgi:hypothetical protein
VRKIGLGLLVILLLAACSQQLVPTPDATLAAGANSWQNMDGALDITAAKSAVEPKLVLDRAGKIFVAWREDGKIYLKRRMGTVWQAVGPGLPSTSGTVYRRIFPAFNLVFDGTNSPVVVTGTTNGTAVYRLNPQSNVWQRLGSVFTGPAALSADNTGAVYSVRSYNDKNFIRRWTGTGWQIVYTFRYYARVVGGGSLPASVHAIGFTSDGRPFVKFQYPGYPGEGETLSVWNGTSWDVRNSALIMGDLDRQDQDLLLRGELTHLYGTDAPVNPVQGNTQLYSEDAPLLSNDPLFTATLTVDNLNRPVVTTITGVVGYNDLVIKRWVGGAWVDIGGVLDRMERRNVTWPSVVVNGNGTVYAAWQECVAVSAENCTNFDVFVSKYAQ